MTRDEAIENYRQARAAYCEAVRREDAAFARYFAKLQRGEPTNGAAVSRLANQTTYRSADLARAQGKLWLLDEPVEPWDIDDEDGVERTPV